VSIEKRNDLGMPEKPKLLSFPDSRARYRNAESPGCLTCIVPSAFHSSSVRKADVFFFGIFESDQFNSGCVGYGSPRMNHYMGGSYHGAFLRGSLTPWVLEGNLARRIFEGRTSSSFLHELKLYFGGIKAPFGYHSEKLHIQVTRTASTTVLNITYLLAE